MQIVNHNFKISMINISIGTQRRTLRPPRSAPAYLCSFIKIKNETKMRNEKSTCYNLFRIQINWFHKVNKSFYKKQVHWGGKWAVAWRCWCASFLSLAPSTFITSLLHPKNNFRLFLLHLPRTVYIIEETRA